MVAAQCESGGIGRRTRLRIWRVKPWGFESPLSHQLQTLRFCAFQFPILNNATLGSRHVTREWHTGRARRSPAKFNGLFDSLIGVLGPIAFDAVRGGVLASV